MTPTTLTSLAAAVVALVAVAVTVGSAAGLDQWRDVLTAVARAAVQLVVVGLVIAAVFRTPRLAPLYLTVVLAAAAVTSGRRIGPDRRTTARAAVAIGLGAAAAAVVVYGCRALAWEVRTAVPFIAQLTGGAMTATSLAGQRLRDDVVRDWAEVEAWLALGVRPALAVRPLARRAAARALVPALDQTRTVGLVTLPGAYVGLLLAGAGPVQAGRVQLLVLVGLIAAETVAATTITRLLAPAWGTRRPG